MPWDAISSATSPRGTVSFKAQRKRDTPWRMATLFLTQNKELHRIDDQVHQNCKILHSNAGRPRDQQQRRRSDSP
jgi:hypothetical protein